MRVQTVSIAILLMVFGFVLGAMFQESAQVPMCSEDTVLVGAGDYERGRFDYYFCGPALDDIRPITAAEG